MDAVGSTTAGCMFSGVTTCTVSLGAYATATPNDHPLPKVALTSIAYNLVL